MRDEAAPAVAADVLGLMLRQDKYYQTTMSVPSSTITRSKRRANFTISEAELEAKRRHKESCGIEELEKVVATIIKDEPPPDQNPVDAVLFAAIGETSGGANSNEDVPGPALNSFDEAIRVLARFFQHYDEDDHFVHGAFLTVLERRLDLLKGPRARDAPFPELEGWIMKHLVEMRLPIDKHGPICSALREAAIGRVVRNWQLKHGASEADNTLELLQGVLEHGNHAVLDVVHVLQSLQLSPRPLLEKICLSLDSTTGSDVRHAKAQPTAFAAEAGMSKQSKCEKTARAAAEKKKLGTRRTKTALYTSRSRSVPLGAASESHLYGRHDAGTQYQILAVVNQSSTTALARLRQGHETKNKRPIISPATSNRLDLNVSKTAAFSVSKGRSNASITLRYIKSDSTNLLLFFVGPDMNDVRQEEIIAACSEAYRKHPFHTYRWSRTVWVSQMNIMPEVFTDLVTLRGHQLTATNTNSNPIGHFVASLGEFEVDDQQLQTYIAKAIAQLHHRKAPGRHVIYRAPYTAKHGHLVFLHLFKSPPKPLFPVAVVGKSGDTAHLIFKPAIKDYEEDCFYCGRIHEDLVCPSAVQVSNFGQWTKK